MANVYGNFPGQPRAGTWVASPARAASDAIDAKTPTSWVATASGESKVPFSSGYLTTRAVECAWAMPLFLADGQLRAAQDTLLAGRPFTKDTIEALIPVLKAASDIHCFVVTSSEEIHAVDWQRVRETLGWQQVFPPTEYHRPRQLRMLFLFYELRGHWSLHVARWWDRGQGRVLGYVHSFDPVHEGLTSVSPGLWDPRFESRVDHYLTRLHADLQAAPIWPANTEFRPDGQAFVRLNASEEARRGGESVMYIALEYVSEVCNEESFAEDGVGDFLVAGLERHRLPAYRPNRAYNGIWGEFLALAIGRLEAKGRSNVGDGHLWLDLA